MAGVGDTFGQPWNQVSDPLNGANQQFSEGSDQNFWFNPAAFAKPAAGTFGNAPRNLIIGPGSKNLNAQLSRDLRMKNNRAVTIQATASNILNIVNYAAIDTLVNSPTFGQVLSVRPMRSAQLNFRFRF